MKSKTKAANPNFSRIMEGLDEAVAIAAGAAAPAQVHRAHAPDVDVRAIRVKRNMTQNAFADHYGFGLGTVRDWEQRRRRPEAAARVLLLLIERRPDVVEEVLRAAAPPS